MQQRFNGWLLLAHPHFEDQYARWSKEVANLAKKDPNGYRQHERTKRLAALEKLVFEIIPNDPSDSRYLLGNSLGTENRSWRRAKFGSQYRVFFRFDQRAKIIVYGWVNHTDSLRAYGSKTDAYLVFAKMLASGSPPTSWDELISESVTKITNS